MEVAKGEETLWIHPSTLRAHKDAGWTPQE